MVTYKIFKYMEKISSINKYNDDIFVCSIPFDPDNTDYQQYLAWVAQGNEPLPADE